MQQPFQDECQHRNARETWQKIPVRARMIFAADEHRLNTDDAFSETWQSAEKSVFHPCHLWLNLRMKNFVQALAVFAAAVFYFSGCGKKSETSPEKSAANYPLPDPPLVADCKPGIPGGRLVMATYRRSQDIQSHHGQRRVVRGHLPASVFRVARFDSVHAGSHAGAGGLRGRIRRTAKRGRSICGKICAGATAQPLTADDVVFTCNDVIYNTNINTVMRDAFTWTEKFHGDKDGRFDDPGRHAGGLRAVSGRISARACRSCRNTSWKNPSRTGLSPRLTA